MYARARERRVGPSRALGIFRALLRSVARQPFRDLLEAVPSVAVETVHALADEAEDDGALSVVGALLGGLAGGVLVDDLLALALVLVVVVVALAGAPFTRRELRALFAGVARLADVLHVQAEPVLAVEAEHALADARRTADGVQRALDGGLAQLALVQSLETLALGLSKTKIHSFIVIISSTNKCRKYMLI